MVSKRANEVFKEFNISFETLVETLKIWYRAT